MPSENDEHYEFCGVLGSARLSSAQPQLQSSFVRSCRLPERPVANIEGLMRIYCKSGEG